MSYLKDYLKVIPKVDANRIRENIADNKEVFEVRNLSEKEYERLVFQLAEESIIQTEPSELEQTITADSFNQFYSNVTFDLSRLFPEQNHIELAGENYDRIYQGHLEELKKEIDALSRNIERLEQQQRGESGLIIRSYGFEPEEREANAEHLNSETAYLFTDRDGSALNQTTNERLFHTYFLSLGKRTETNLIENHKGISTAKLEVVYESPYTLINQNENYQIEKAIDGDSSTFWFNVALKPDNGLDSVSISPRKEVGK